MSDGVEEIAKGLTEAMWNALDRLARAMVWIDGRSREALVRRNLARKHGSCTDALFGQFEIVTITPLGRDVLAVRNHLSPPDTDGGG